MAIDWQQSFAAGEIHPALHRRTDRLELRHGAHTIRNFILTGEGSLRNRPGTQHVAIPQGNWVPNSLLFPVPFVSTSLAVSQGALSRVLFSLASGYCLSAGSYGDRRYSFLGGFDLHEVTGALSRVVTLGERSVATLKTGAAVSIPWDISGSLFTLPHIEQFATVDPVVTDLLHVSIDSLAARPYAAPDKSSDRSLGFNGDADNPTRAWVWLVSWILRDNDGRLFESGAWPVDNTLDSGDNAISYAPSAAVSGSLPWRIDTGAAPGEVVTAGTGVSDDMAGTEFTVVASRVYRCQVTSGGAVPQRSQVYTANGFTLASVGFVGETYSRHFFDDGPTPEFNNPPRQGRNPFKDDPPHAVTHHQGRRVFALGPKLWASKVEDFNNFDEALPGESGAIDDDDPIELELADDAHHATQNLVSRNRQLWVLSDMGEWVVRGTDDSGVLTPNSGRADKISSHGCADIPAVMAGDTIMFVQRDGNRILALAPNGEITDLTAGGRHLFDNHTITSIAYAHQPNPTVWATRDDGLLLAGVGGGWCPQELSGDGEALAVACVPEGTEDGVYILVRYGARYALERFAKRLWSDVRDAVHLDRSVTFNGKITSQSVTIDSIVQLTFSGSFTNNVGVYIRIDMDDGGGPLLFEMLEETSPSVYSVRLDGRLLPASHEGATIAEFWRCTQSVAMSHLDDGTEVKAVADGKVIEGLTVAAGSVLLPYPAGMVHVGLAYESRFQSLPSAHGRGDQKACRQLFLSVETARGGRVAETLDDEKWESLPGRAVSDGYGLPALRTAEAAVSVSSKWTRDAFAAFVQDQPLPVTLVALGRDMVGGGR